MTLSAYHLKKSGTDAARPMLPGGRGILLGARGGGAGAWRGVLPNPNRLFRNGGVPD